MRSWPLYYVLGLTLLVHPPRLAAQQTVTARNPASAQLRQQIEAVNRGMEEAFARGDLRAVARFYADDAVMLGPGGERVQGREAIDRYWGGVSNPRRWKLEVYDVGGSLNEAYQLGRSSLTSLNNQGQERTSVTDFIVIWKRAPGAEWKIAVDMWPGSAPSN